jgi:hypothetical protein
MTTPEAIREVSTEIRTLLADLHLTLTRLGVAIVLLGVVTCDA